MAGKLGAAHGVQWFKCGWEIFRANAITWVLITLVLFALAVVAGLIPFFGSLAFMIVMPVLLGGICRMGAGDAPVEISSLFALFRDPGRRTPLMVLGLILFGVSVLLSFTFGLALIGSLPGHWLEGPEPDPAVLIETMLSGRNLLLLTVLMLAQLVLGFGFFFALGLVTFRGSAPGAAFKAGVQAAFQNLLPLLVFGTIYALLAFIAAIPLGLGLLVLIPVTLLGGYCAYRDIAGAGSGGQLTA